ncbi:hypothetical protein AB0J74_21150 [Asanoa sp. NPDC049573]|uniref:hypothetical protein n=1 Tax=Asanoa sp. NPDC049573 TaxID=3155396 RepID=UPI0034423CC1
MPKKAHPSAAAPLLGLLAQLGLMADRVDALSLHGRAPVTWPVRVGAVPPLADRRVERPADRSLAEAIAATDGQAVVLGQVLSGLGGVGKTQIAAALAHQQWTAGRVDLLVWVPVTSRTAITTAYADAHAPVTGIDEPGPATIVRDRPSRS